MAAVMYFGLDDRIPKILEEVFRIRMEEYGETHSVTHITDPKKLDEVFVAIAFDVMFFQQSALALQPSDWIKTFRKKYSRTTGHLILVGDETDPGKLLTWLEQGFTDYIVFPPDKPLIVEKVILYSSGSRTSDRQVYSLKTAQSTDLAKPGILEELSEFDCRIRATREYPINDLEILYSKAFGNNGAVLSPALARCYRTEKHPTLEGFYVNYFYYVGASPELLTNIRTTLRKTYVQAKR
jgi:hypothetical protein